MTVKQTFAVLIFLAVNVAAAQTAPENVPELQNSQEANVYFGEREREIRAENARRLAEINKAFGDAVDALSAENVARIQALMAENAAAHEALAERDDLSAAERGAESRRIQDETQQARAELLEWMQASRQQLDEEHAANRAAQLAETQDLIDRVNEQRQATLNRLINRPASLGGVITPVESGAGGDDEGVPKSGSTGATNYDRHCDLCHGQPGLRTMPIDLYPVVVEDDADYFLYAVREGRGPMNTYDAINALTDAEVLAIRDFVREQGDINTGVVASGDDPLKTPDPESPPTSDTGGAPPAGPVAGIPSGLPAVDTGSPLPNEGPAGSDAVREAQTESFGSAYLTCNVTRDVEVRWIAPLGWRAGWIPPGGTMQSPENTWGDAWMLRLRARLEDPATTNSGGNPAPGWCTFTDGSLGSVAGKSREIMIFAHTNSAPFEHYRFTNAGVEVHRTNNSISDPGGSFAVEVIKAVHGLHMPAGNRTTGVNGEVHGNVKRIDDRWSGSGEPAFLVIN